MRFFVIFFFFLMFSFSIAAQDCNIYLSDDGLGNGDYKVENLSKQSVLGLLNTVDLLLLKNNSGYTLQYSEKHNTSFSEIKQFLKNYGFNVAENSDAVISVKTFKKTSDKATWKRYYPLRECSGVSEELILIIQNN